MTMYGYYWITAHAISGSCCEFCC